MRSATRRVALRERGLAAISSADGRTGLPTRRSLGCGNSRSRNGRRIGTSVRAVAKGRVDYVSEDFGTYGQMVVVNHGDGYYTLYGHLSSISVASGAEMGAGQLIGYSGDTGSLKGPVLHFEVRKGAQPLNPERWLK